MVTRGNTQMTTSQPPRGEPDDVDARFADIVSRWDDAPDEARPDPEPPVVPVDDARAHTAPDPWGGPETEGAPPGAPEPAPLFGSPVPWRVHEVPEDLEDEGYEPPPPAPLPSPLHDWPFYLALVGLVGGPLWLVALAIFAPTEHSLMWMAGLLAAAGFVTLVVRQPRERDVDDDDDGARV